MSAIPHRHDGEPEYCTDDHGAIARGETTTRADHLAWCKQRALQYVDAGDLTGAYASMTSDLGKHEGARSPASWSRPIWAGS